MLKKFPGRGDKIMNVFVLNCGSSSVKFQIVNTDLELFEDDLDHVVAKGLIEKVGSNEAVFTFESEGYEPVKGMEPLADHREAILRIRTWMESDKTKINGVLGWNDIKLFHALSEFPHFFQWKRICKAQF